MIALAALSIALQLARPAVDVLDGISMEVVARNPAKTPVNVSFPAPAEYELRVFDGSKLLWTSLTPQPPEAHFPAHQRLFIPGPTVVAVYIWNALTAEGATPGPGTYTVRARLLTGGSTQEATASVRIINPVPIAAIEKLQPGDEVTIAGTIDAAGTTLTDSTGSIRLLRKVSAAAGSSLAVRGYITVATDKTRAFYVKRFAPMLAGGAK